MNLKKKMSHCTRLYLCYMYINIPLSYIELFTKDGKRKNKDEKGNLQEEEEVRSVLRQASVDVTICTSLLVSRQVEEQL